MESYREGADHAAEYVSVIKGVWPLVALSWIVALLFTLGQLKRGYRQRTIWQTIAMILLNSAMTSAMAVSCAMLLSSFLPNLTLEAQVGICVAAAGLGAESLKAMLYKKLHLHVVDLMDPEDINDIRCRMTPEQRLLHVSRCPFKADECHKHCEVCHLLKLQEAQHESDSRGN